LNLKSYKLKSDSIRLVAKFQHQKKKARQIKSVSAILLLKKKSLENWSNPIDFSTNAKVL